MISLLSFVQTGYLGPVGLNSSREAVESEFGSPPSWDAESQPDSARIWKYGALEIYFDNHQVWMIFTDDFHVDLHMGTIAFDASGIHGRMTFDAVKSWLLSHSVAFERTEWQWCDRGVRIETNSGVTFTFCAEEESSLAFLCSLALVRR